MIHCYIASYYKVSRELDTTRIIKSRGRVRKTAAVRIAVYTLPFMAVPFTVFAQKSKPATSIWVTIETYSSDSHCCNLCTCLLLVKNDVNLQM